MKKLTIGVLGAARITPSAIIDPAKVIAGVEVTACAASTLDKAKAFAAANGITTVLERYDDLIKAPDIDLIYNPLPINLHAEWTIKALEAGKHVLCEKPFAMNLDEARRMVDVAKTHNRRLVEAFHYRYHPAYQTCLDWLASGQLGQIEQVDTVFNVPIPYTPGEIRHSVETGGGAMMDLGCYSLAWALDVLDGTPQIISADSVLTHMGVDESMRAQLRFPNGAIANIAASMAPAAGTFEAAMHIRGTKGEIIFKNPLMPPQAGRLSLKTSQQQTEALIHPVTTYSWQLAAVLEGIQNGTPLPTEGTATLRQQAALDAVYVEAGLRHLRWR